jgi:hypothetical protein
MKRSDLNLDFLPWKYIENPWQMQTLSGFLQKNNEDKKERKKDISSDI